MNKNKNPEEISNKKFYEKCEDQYDSVKSKIIPRRESDNYNKRKSKYDNGTVRVFYY